MEMEIDVEKFIKEVSRHPVIWDKYNKQYHNRHVVDKNWKTIETIMKHPKDQLKKKWKCLRDQFRVEWRKYPYNTWPYFKSMIFLKDQIKTRNSCPIEEPLSEEISNNEEQETLNNNNDGYIDLPEEEETVSPYEGAKTNVQSNTNQFDILAIERKKLQLLAKNLNREKVRNDDECFFTSLMPFMKNMPLEQKLLCRMEIQKVVYNHAFPIARNSASETQSSSGYNSAPMEDELNLQRLPYDHSSSLDLKNEITESPP